LDSIVPMELPSLSLVCVGFQESRRRIIAPPELDGNEGDRSHSGILLREFRLNFSLDKPNRFSLRSHPFFGAHAKRHG
jgi:hypothetical protein